MITLCVVKCQCMQSARRRLCCRHCQCQTCWPPSLWWTRMIRPCRVAARADWPPTTPTHSPPYFTLLTTASTASSAGHATDPTSPTSRSVFCHRHGRIQEFTLGGVVPSSLPFLPSPHLPFSLERWSPLGSLGERSRVQDRAPAENEFFAF